MTDHEFLKEYTFANGAHVQNRIVMAPMTTKASFYDGQVTNDEINYYRMRSGVGMIITGTANVDDGGKGFEGELSVADDRFIPGLRQVASAIKSKGSKAILQIFSAGRMTNSKILRGKQPYSASAVAALRPEAEEPRELTEAEIEQLIADFGQATRRAIEAGFDGVELHGANTYLLQQFFSPHSNRRDDKWGGSLEKRMAFPLAVIKEARKAIDQFGKDDFILGYRLSPEEIEEPGIRIEDTLKFVDVLADQPLDYLHVSMGSYKRTSLNNKDDHEMLNQKILKILAGRLPLLVVGSIARPEEADDALNQGASFAVLGRELIREPQWIDKVLSGDEDSIRYQLDKNEMDELAIPRGFQTSLLTEFKKAMNFKPIAD
ncbi:NADH-dependent flavin oxidoreductase [Lactobacillus nasalidis]|uniref:NADH-dependent flavin oxidoreductase n=1 Tax=Lactobacillus nasalidis TaxID=2797258 RepID=A0ABQ3W567_9LACO|nr:NADH-dependent flavin oxidoreductase [Lactobacillus nasalidis]GHV97303.1 NADH-dependent flavin oxidoreductase [Lactobacillus nasalidis]GHV99054.1 NADH-dependent flavin oxidoreductase [Lactobacillus nasalidis]GHW00480.1 NADH-dependent flavin oxidoreductase [Lactobacillus nasalidis]